MLRLIPRTSVDLRSTVTVTQGAGDVTEWSTLFAPDDDVHGALVFEIKSALSLYDAEEIECHSSQYGFTDPDIAALLIFLASNPASRFLFDKTQAAGHYEAPIIEQFRDAISESQVAVGTSSVAHQILHTKAVALLYPDGTGWTFTGSYNLSASAAKQFNVVDVVRSRSRAELFASMIDKMFNWVAQNEPQGGAS